MRSNAALAGVLSSIVASVLWAPSAQAIRCSDVHSPLRFTERLSEKKGVRVMAYNLMNLMDKVGGYDQTQPFQFTKRPGQGNDAAPKTPKQQQELAEAFHEERPDFVIATEVESVNALKEYSNKNLREAYDSYLTEGNDPRGIDIGLLVKKGLKVEVESRTNKQVMWNDPVTKTSIPLFSRDLPVWIIKDAKTKKPLMALVGMHAKSKRNRDGDTESNIWRTAQMQKGAEIVNELAKELGPDVPLLWGGDFNTDIQTSHEVAPIKSSFRDSFDAAKKSIAPNFRITHTYHPKQGPADAKQMDAIFVRQSDANKIEQAHIYRYRDAEGRVKAIPKTFQQREQNPSDHFPVVVDLRLEN